jgi:osmotically-inducible protein OsmY
MALSHSFGASWPPSSPGSMRKKRQELDTLESIDDASITALVKTTLLYHRSTSTLGVTVETKNGVVKLEVNRELG